MAELINNKKILYAVKIIGGNAVEEHIKNLQSDSAFSLSVSRKENKTIVTITGPKKDSENVSLQDLNEQLSDNARKRGLDAPEIVRKVIHDIYDAQKAEKFVLDGDMVFEAETKLKSYSGFVTLDVTYEEGPHIEASIDYYASWRITCVANVMRVTIEGSIMKNAGKRLQ